MMYSVLVTVLTFHRDFLNLCTLHRRCELHTFSLLSVILYNLQHLITVILYMYILTYIHTYFSTYSNRYNWSIVSHFKIRFSTHQKENSIVFGLFALSKILTLCSCFSLCISCILKIEHLDSYLYCQTTCSVKVRNITTRGDMNYWGNTHNQHIHAHNPHQSSFWSKPLKNH